MSKSGLRCVKGARETISRQTLHQLEQAGIVEINPDNPKRPTNSPNTVYAIEGGTLKVIKKYGTPGWDAAVNKWVKRRGKLIDRYEKRRKKHLISVDLPGGPSLDLSPGKHNKLQVKVITELAETTNYELCLSAIASANLVSKKFLRRHKIYAYLSRA